MKSIDARPISFVLQGAYASIIASVERFTAGRHWILKTFLVCVAFSILFSGGLDLKFMSRGGYPQSYFLKVDHPLLNVARLYHLNSHDANLNFRLTVPVVLHFFHVHGFWSLPFVTVYAICLTIVVSCVAAFQLTNDRVCSFFFALEVASTYVGSFGFIAYYDVIAVCQLALASLRGMPWWVRSILIFTASFTDERAFVASGLLLMGGFFIYGPHDCGLQRLLNPRFYSVAIGMAAYLVGRILLMKLAGLTSPTGGIGPGQMVNENLFFVHPVVWFSLEGGWVFCFLAISILIMQRRFLSATSLIAGACIYLSFALLIGDVMRSAIFIFPLLLVSLHVVAKNDTPSSLRFYCFLAFLISALGGNYNVFLNQITWFQPLVVQVCQLLGQLVYAHLYAYLPHAVPTVHPGYP